MLLGGAKREAPAQAELRPTCAGASNPGLGYAFMALRAGYTALNTYGARTLAVLACELS
jgi:hypothetical protein